MSDPNTIQEELVIEVIREYLNKNRQFNMKKMLPFIISRFRLAKVNINKLGVEKILKRLVEKNFIIEGSKLMRSDVLINHKRRNIYNHIIKNPGCHFNRLLNELTLSNHVVVWHLNVLIKFQLIKKIKIENRDIYFDSTKDLQSVLPHYYRSKEKSKVILEFIKENPGATKTKMGKELGIHFNTITKYLNDLERYNIVYSKKKSKKILYYLN